MAPVLPPASPARRTKSYPRLIGDLTLATFSLVPREVRFSGAGKEDAGGTIGQSWPRTWTFGEKHLAFDG